MAVDDCTGDSIEPAPTDDARREPASERAILVVTDADGVERWVGDGADSDVAVVGPDRGAEFGLEPDGGAVVASVDPTDGTADVARSTRLGAPLERGVLLEAIDRLNRRARYDALLAEYARLAAGRGKLEAERDEADLAADREYRGLRRRLADVEADLDDVTRTFDGEDFRAAFETGGFGGACERAD
ncbi:HalX domain-containing protein [Saliphagus sp. LR7]|uniref:HalX domain-containing protein n=1 Tax=Saliphagus sp. LR7 TaxID=2282654 RepID=UPI000DF85D82|nr:HalX domain-containing protein [Saliphagus sp. LR7]